MIVQCAALLESISEKLNKIIVHVCHGQKHFSEISYSRDIEFFFKLAAASSVIAYRNDSCYVYREKLESRKDA